MEWKIVQCDYLGEHEGKNKVVNNVHWEVVKTDGEYMGRSYGSVAIPTDDLSSFVEFDSLDEEAVIGWTKEQLGDEQVTAQESSVTAQINEQKNPTKGSGVPW
jgi:hypothetical protein